MSAWKWWQWTKDQFTQVFKPRPMQEGRRTFLKGLGASMVAALVAPNLPSIEETIPGFKVVPAQLDWTFHAGFDLIKQIEQKALAEIMAAEDARVFELLDKLSWGQIA